MRRLFVYFLFLINAGSIFSQGSSDIISQLNVDKKVISSSPNVSALNQYNDVPVNLSTGAVSISIPIFTIDYKGFRMPISLNYSNNGIRVNQEASFVGLGWSLDAGGQISRDIRGIADETEYNHLPVPIDGGSQQIIDYGLELANGVGYIHRGNNTKQFCLTNSPGIDIGRYMYWGAYSYWDTEPDEYNYSLPSSSGHFVFDTNGDVIQIEENNMKITPVFGVGSNDNMSFEVVDENGFKYNFDEKEASSRINGSCKHLNDVVANPFGLMILPTNPSVYVSSGLDCATPIGTVSKPTAWNLTKVSDENGIEIVTINYTYQENVYTYYSDADISHPDFAGPSNYGNTVNEIVKTYVSDQTRSPQTITWPEGEIDFYYTDYRDDVGDDNGGVFSSYALSKVVVKNYIGEIIKEVEFTYDYFGSIYTNTPRERRLKLTEVQETTGGTPVPAYKFDYSGIEFPSKNSFETDFFGFYKPYGHDLPLANPNASFQRYVKMYLYPSDTSNPVYGNSIYSIYPRSSFVGNEYILPGESRDPDPITGQAGMLTEIQYPTGGKDMFEYEPHDFIFDGTERIGGGYRIKRITRIFGNNLPDKITNFDYSIGANSSGKLLSLPDFGKLFHNEIFETEPSQFWTFIDAMRYTVRSYTPSNRITYHNGSYVLYSQVTVSQPGNGKTVYTYNVPIHQEVPSYGNFGGETIYKRSESERFEYIEDVVQDRDTIWDPFVPGQFTVHWLETFVTQPGYLNYLGKPNHNFPYPPNPNLNFLNGDLLTTTTYDELGNILTETSLEYELKNLRKIYANKINHYRRRSYLLYGLVTQTTVNQYDAYFGKYYYLSGWKVLSKKTEKIFEQGGSNYLVKEARYKYDNPNHHQITSITETSSTADTYITEFKYAQDYSIAPGSTQLESIGLRELKERNIIKPVEYIQKLKRGGSEWVIGGQVFTYKLTDLNHLVLHKNYVMELKEPTNSIANTIYSSSSFSIDEAYILKDVFKYDGFDNLIQITSTNNFTTSFIWGYPKAGSIGYMYPVAKVVGAASNKSYFKNFEWSDGNSTNAKTGNQARSGNYTIVSNISDGPVNGKYRLTYWEYLSGAWQIKSSVINFSNTYTINSSGIIDDVSLIPELAQISSYTYTPLKGITSVSSPSYVVTNYEFDLLGRLTKIKDLDKNILNIYKYNFKQ